MSDTSADLGKDARFVRFYKEVQPRLITWLTWSQGNSWEAEDVASEAFHILYPRFDEVTSPTAYIYKVADRLLKKRYQLAEHRKRAWEAFDDLPYDLEQPNSDVLHHFLDKERAQELLSELRTLPPRQRQVLSLTVDGYAPEEIAKILGISPTSTRANLSHARRRMREMKAEQEQASATS